METVAKISTSTLVSYPIMSYLYGGLKLNTMGQKWSLPLLLSVGSGLGYLVSDFAHDKIMPSLHISEKFATPTSALVNVAANAGTIVGSLAALNPNAVSEIEKMKLLLASGGSAVASHYVYQNFVRPMYFSDSQYGY